MSFPTPQDNMNAMLEGVTVTGRDGKVTNLEQVRWRRMAGGPLVAA